MKAIDTAEGGVRALARNAWRLVADVAIATSDKNLSHIAAGVAFYMLLSIFPAIVVALSLAGLFADVHGLSLFEALGQNLPEPTAKSAGALLMITAAPANVSFEGAWSLLGAMQPILPDGVYDMIAAQVERTVAAGGLELGGAAVVSFFIAFWSASAAMRALMTAMHIAFPHSAATNTFWYYVLSLAFTLAAMALVGVVALVLTALPFVLATIQAIASATGVPIDFGLLGDLETPIVMLVSCAFSALVYRLGAARGPRAWRAAFKAGVIATLFWVVCSAALGYYFNTVGDIGTTYGPLAAFVGLMLWFWISALILLIGAELAAYYSGNGVAERRAAAEDGAGVALES